MVRAIAQNRFHGAWFVVRLWTQKQQHQNCREDSAMADTKDLPKHDSQQDDSDADAFAILSGLVIIFFATAYYLAN